MVAAMVIATVTMSFKMSSSNTTWHYVGEAVPNVYNNIENWEEGESEETCTTYAPFPCEIEAASISALEDMLDGKTNLEVLDIVTGTRY